MQGTNVYVKNELGKSKWTSIHMSFNLDLN